VLVTQREKVIALLIVAAAIAGGIYLSPPVAHARARRVAYSCFAITRTATAWEDCVRGRGYDPWEDFWQDDEVQQRLMILRLRR
jgi:hypothetical protein